MRPWIRTICLSVAAAALLGCPGSSGPRDAGADGGDAGPYDFIEDAGINRLTVGGGWSCLAYVSGNDLWIRTNEAGTPRFDYRIGAGGALAELKQIIGASEQAWLASSVDGEVTDRVVQWKWWSNSVLGTVDGGDPRWNVVQAGTFLNPLDQAAYVLSPTVSATIMNTSSECGIDVYSVPQDQWNPRLQSELSGKISALTRYRVVQNGELLIRRTSLVGSVFADGGAPDHLAIEAWSPFDRTLFNAVATRVDDGGRPTTYYSTGSSFPTAPLDLDVASSGGYGVVLTVPAPQLNPAVGLVFGTQPPCLYHANVCAPVPSPVQVPPWPLDAGEGSVPAYALEIAELNTGVVLIPQMSFRGLQTGTLVDQYLILIPNRVMGASLAAELMSAAPLIPAPRILAPNSHLEPSLAATLSTLQANLSQAGTRTDHLAPLLTH